MGWVDGVETEFGNPSIEIPNGATERRNDFRSCSGQNPYSKKTVESEIIVAGS